MKNFTIENETNNITIYGTVKEAEAVPNSERFSSEAALAKLAANWPAARLVEIWNSLAGETQVKKFKDRATAVSRIWKAIQNLGTEPDTAAVIEKLQAAEVVPATSEVHPAAELVATDPEAEPILTEEAISATPEPAVAAPVSAQTPDVAPAGAPAKNKATRAKKAPKTNDGAPREGSKTSQVIAMLKRDGGTTVEEIMTAMQWQKHTTRAMLSAGGSLTKNHGLTIVSEKVGEHRRYSIKA
jgi:Protein of unknown function (DUF3489)